MIALEHVDNHNQRFFFIWTVLKALQLQELMHRILNAAIVDDLLYFAFFLNSCCNPLNNYMVFNDTDGLYTYTFEAERKVT